MRKKRILFTAMLCISVMTIIPGCGKKSDDDITNEEVYGEMEPLTDEGLKEMEADTGKDDDMKPIKDPESEEEGNAEVIEDQDSSKEDDMR